MVSENTFEFDDQDGDRYRVRLEQQAAFLDAYIESDGGRWLQQMRMPYEAVRALLAERTRRDEVFARLKEYVTNTGYYDKEYIEALQAEWEGTAAPGEAEVTK